MSDIEKSVIEKTNFDIKVGSIVSASYFALGTLFSIIRSSNIAIWFTWGSYFLFKALRPMKLRKDIALAGWIIDNEDKVNEVLREEVDINLYNLIYEIEKIQNKQNYAHYFDIRTNHLNEKDWRRSFSIN